MTRKLSYKTVLHPRMVAPPKKSRETTMGNFRTFEVIFTHKLSMLSDMYCVHAPTCHKMLPPTQLQYI